MTTRWSETPAYRDLMRNAEEWMALGDWMLDWQLGCAWYAGRRSVIESEEMEIVRQAAGICASYKSLDAFESSVLAPISSAALREQAAAIRRAVEGLR